MKKLYNPLILGDRYLAFRVRARHGVLGVVFVTAGGRRWETTLPCVVEVTLGGCIHDAGSVVPQSVSHGFFKKSLLLWVCFPWVLGKFP